MLICVGWVPALRADESAEPFTPELYNVHFQTTLLPEFHPPFSAKYTSRTTSLDPGSELNASFTATLFLGLKVWDGGSLYADPEVPAGSGFSNVTGIGEFPNGEISKVGTPNPTYNQSRIYFQQVLGLGGEQEKIDDDQNQLSCKEDISRLTLTAGKFALGDFFDNNALAHDARTQFMNLTFGGNAAWDYSADTHGYTVGIVADLNQKDWAFRFCEAMVSTQPNGSVYDTNLAQAHSENAELEWRYGTDRGAGKFRFLVYDNAARMGRYTDALSAMASSPGTLPDVTAVQQYSDKFGLGLNWEQLLSANYGLFARLGWNDGQTETWMYTAVDQVASLGFSARGEAWGCAGDNAGLALAIAGISAQHQAYLAAGGTDFDIGDGALNYAPEEVFEFYYLYKPIPSFGLTLDLQGVNHPAYNQDRGPVGILACRVHYEI